MPRTTSSEIDVAFLSSPDAHDGAVDDQPDHVFLIKPAPRPGLPVGLHFPPDAADRVLADRPLEQRRQRPAHPAAIGAGEVGAGDRRFHLLGHPGIARQRAALPLAGLAVSTTDARPRHRDLDRSERAGDPSLAMTVPVTVARRDTAPLGGRRALGRAGFAIAAPMPAFVASASQGGGQLLLDQLFDENPDPIPDSRLDRVGPGFPQKQRRLVRRRRAIRRHGVISAGATTPALAVERAGDYATLKFQPLPRRHLLERARTCVMSSGAKSTTSSP